jgi:hypothetical protein
MSSKSYTSCFLVDYSEFGKTTDNYYLIVTVLSLRIAYWYDS